MISLIMPCYIVNDELLKLTQAAIDSLKGTHLIIVDNGSPIGGGYLRSVAQVYVRNQINLGYAKAVNQGLHLATTKLIAIANNDIRLSPNWQLIAKEALSDPTIYSCHFRMTDYDTPFEYGHISLPTGRERWCTSSFFVINAEKNLFFYDENYLNSYDDWDYWYMVRKSGLKTAYTDMACYQHKHSTTQALIPEREENNTRNREYFKIKWGEYPEVLFEREYPEQMKKDYQLGFNL